MKFTNYKKALIILVAATFLITGFYLESKFPETTGYNLRDIDTITEFIGHGLSQGEFVCTDLVKIRFVYPNHSVSVPTREICNRLIWKS